MEQTSSNKKMGIGIALAVIIIVAVIIAFSMKDSNTGIPNTTANNATSTSNTTPTEQIVASSTTNQTTQTSSSSTTETDTTKKTVYKDGTYTATGSYMSPGGAYKVEVTLVVKNDVVASADVVPMAGDRMSQRYQAMFIDGYKTFVVGKNLSGLNVGKVSGSSLTPKGFNDAVAQIRVQAKA